MASESWTLIIRSIAFDTVRRSIPVALAKPDIEAEGTSFNAASTSTMAWGKSTRVAGSDDDIAIQDIFRALFLYIHYYVHIIMATQLCYKYQLRNIT